MKVVKATGLVPVRDKASGDIYGVTPEKAVKAVNEGKADLVEIPDDIETETISVNVPEQASQQAETAEVVEIPDDWENLHHLKMIALAKKIMPEFVALDGEKPGETAKRIILAELDRRTAPSTPHPEGDNE